MYPFQPSAPSRKDALDEPQIVQSVTAVPAMTKRYRGVVVMNVQMTAVVEFEAPENADPYTMADQVCDLVPPEAWEKRGESYCYLESWDETGEVAEASAPSTAVA